MADTFGKPYFFPMRLPRVLLHILAVLPLGAAAAQQRSFTPPELKDGAVYRLWTGDAPGAMGKTDADIPTLTAVIPSYPRPNATAVVVCPGGAYHFLATEHEGTQVARYFALLGIPAFVLHYRITPYHHPIELGDAQRAIRFVRAAATAWHLDPKRIGIIGFSAGGHLAMTASTIFDTGIPSSTDPIDHVSSRPDFSVLGYAVLTLKDPWTHTGSRKGLLGEHPDSALVERLSGENAVTPQTPPTFVFTTNDDKLVPAENSLLYIMALRKAGVPNEFHMFQPGEHGVGMAMNLIQDDMSLAEWPRLLANWLRANGFR